MDIVLLIIGLAVSLAGLAGCIIPILPGPPLSYGALVIIALVRKNSFSWTFMIIMGVIAAIVTMLDFVLPAAGAKRYGGSSWGVWGSAAGMFIGIFVIPPWGMLICGFAGAVAGEIIAGKKGRDIFRAGWGVFVGTFVATVLKLIASGVMLYYYVVNMF